MSGGALPRWQPWEDEVIARVYPLHGAEGCSEELMGRRTPKACASRAKRLGVRSRLNRGSVREWTPEEDRWCVMQLAVMCRRVRRSPQAVCAHLMYLSGKAKRVAP